MKLILLFHILLYICFCYPLQGSSTIPKFDDNKLRASAEIIDITPDIIKKKVYIAGFGQNRVATGIHSPITARILTISYNNEYVVFIALDFVGLLHHRIVEMKHRIIEKTGIDKDKIIIATTHNHQGPDTIGLWGKTPLQSGVDEEYMEDVYEKIAEGVATSIKRLKIAKVKFGKINIRDISEYYNGKNFGGKNPHPNIIGLINDLRDPIIVDDLLLVAQFVDIGNNTICTLVNWSSHPEILASGNTLLSSDFPHYLRKKVEELFGGVCIYFIGACGGMMTPLHCPIPKVTEEIEFIYDEKGNILYENPNTVEAARSLGHILAGAVRLALRDSNYENIESIKVNKIEIELPIEKSFFVMAMRSGLLGDIPSHLISYKDKLYIKNNIYHIMIGKKAEFITIPGEILPELVIALPKDFIPAGNRPNKYFPQHNEKEPLSKHMNPFIIKTTPIRELMKSEYKFIIGLCDDEIGYIIPPDDYLDIPPFSPSQGDHYEDTMSIGKNTANIIIKKVEELLTNSYKKYKIKQ